ncbi:hypothetical protein CRENBAI_014645 [Crenichthys baileyi]|uniref:Uncharacterized protein n=1 Tax=Crenichthys baileyi TaxID=28760 RepID=A0AAV9RY21_9TELE
MGLLSVFQKVLESPSLYFRETVKKCEALHMCESPRAVEPRTLSRCALVFPIGNLLWSFKREMEPALLRLSVCLKWFPASCFLALEEDPGSDPVLGTFLADSTDPLKLAALQAPELPNTSKRTRPLSNVSRTNTALNFTNHSLV